MGFITPSHLKRLNHQANIFHLAALSFLHQLQNDRTRSTRFIPDVSRRRGFSQNKSCRFRRFRRIEDLSLRNEWRSLSASFIFRHHFFAAAKYVAHDSFLRH